MDNELEQILTLVDSYIKNKEAQKTWTPGKDWIYYAGPYFNSERMACSRG